MEPVKIIARFSDGRIKRGFSQDFYTDKPSFHLQKDLSGESGELEEVRISELKAVFFVKSFTGNPDLEERKGFAEEDKPSGRKVKVTFTDGEALHGSVLGYDSRQPGFFLFPVDPKSNNMRVYVVNAAVKNFQYLRSNSTAMTNKFDYQSLIPETRGKLLMIDDKERELLRLILSKVIETENGRQYIIDKLGGEYVRIGENLLKQMKEAYENSLADGTVETI